MLISDCRPRRARAAAHSQLRKDAACWRQPNPAKILDNGFPSIARKTFKVLRAERAGSYILFWAGDKIFQLKRNKFLLGLVKIANAIFSFSEPSLNASAH